MALRNKAAVLKSSSLIPHSCGIKVVLAEILTRLRSANPQQDCTAIICYVQQPNANLVGDNSF